MVVFLESTSRHQARLLRELLVLVDHIRLAAHDALADFRLLMIHYLLQRCVLLDYVPLIDHGLFLAQDLRVLQSRRVDGSLS